MTVNSVHEVSLSVLRGVQYLLDRGDVRSATGFAPH